MPWDLAFSALAHHGNIADGLLRLVHAGTNHSAASFLVPLHGGAEAAATGGPTVEHYPPHHGAEGALWDSMPRLQTNMSGHWEDVKVPSHEDAASFLGFGGAHGSHAADVPSSHHEGGGHPEHSSFCGGDGAQHEGSPEGEGSHAEHDPSSLADSADAVHDPEPGPSADGTEGGGAHTTSFKELDPEVSKDLNSAQEKFAEAARPDATPEERAFQADVREGMKDPLVMQRLRAAEHPTEPECHPDYAKCPEGWSHQGTLCVAPDSYQGRCNPEQDLSNATPEQLAAWARYCKFDFPCEA